VHSPCPKTRSRYLCLTGILGPIVARQLVAMRRGGRGAVRRRRAPCLCLNFRRFHCTIHRLPLVGCCVQSRHFCARNCSESDLFPIELHPHHWRTHHIHSVHASKLGKQFACEPSTHVLLKIIRHLRDSSGTNHLQSTVPFVFGRNLQRQPVRGVNFREECHWSHACSLQANMRGIQWHPRV
jgi:hypothetical protein